ncbi:MAG: hypothetical protein Q8S75_20440 [Nitrospirota bacterium]|nr:hypothetical protein [Nitrospirota bacterium]
MKPFFEPRIQATTYEEELLVRRMSARRWDILDRGVKIFCGIAMIIGIMALIIMIFYPSSIFTSPAHD